MSSFKWIANSLKNLRLTGSGTGTGSQVVQARLSSTLAERTATADFPPKPKRPLSPFMRFAVENRQKITEKNPSLKAIDVSRKIGQEWQELDIAKKQNYSKMFQLSLVDYQTHMQAYNRVLTDEQKQTIQQLKLDRHARKEKREKNKRSQSLGKPKRPPTPFIQFVVATVPKGSSSEEYKRQMKELAVKWKEMPDSEKVPFVENFNKHLIAYKRTLAGWEQKMINSGNQDLIRKECLKRLTRKEEGKV